MLCAVSSASALAQCSAFSIHFGIRIHTAIPECAPTMLDVKEVVHGRGLH